MNKLASMTATELLALSSGRRYRSPFESFVCYGKGKWLAGGVTSHVEDNVGRS